ncbi:MAG: hypothetical protein ACKVQU_26275 [Burkholderiales bacterium]
MEIQTINLGGSTNVTTGGAGAGGSSTRPLHVALALSGGGAKGSFEVGALQFLRWTPSVRPRPRPCKFVAGSGSTLT